MDRPKSKSFQSRTPLYPDVLYGYFSLYYRGDEKNIFAHENAFFEVDEIPKYIQTELSDPDISEDIYFNGNGLLIELHKISLHPCKEWFWQPPEIAFTDLRLITYLNYLKSKDLYNLLVLPQGLRGDTEQFHLGFPISPSITEAELDAQLVKIDVPVELEATHIGIYQTTKITGYDWREKDFYEVSM